MILIPRASFPVIVVSKISIQIIVESIVMAAQISFAANKMAIEYLGENALRLSHRSLAQLSLYQFYDASHKSTSA